ncbi:uncharacterized protein LOC135171204 [Diachasmimorpha longicaudata]|uniref:uncharacterized protein LOC135171204 n=1 Tax=Diachasmimorpha longicaudata TaxID=58733 RepID=UPI0030B9082C
MSNDSKKVKKQPYKYCFVPSCANSTVTKPNKVFITVPACKNIRLWCEAAGYSRPLLGRSDICEDHFKLEEDLENYMRWKMTKGPKKLKAGAYPRFFLSQTVAESQSTSQPHSTTSTQCSSVQSIGFERKCAEGKKLKCPHSKQRNNPDDSINSPAKQESSAGNIHRITSANPSHRILKIDRSIQTSIVTSNKNIQVKPTCRHKGTTFRFQDIPSVPPLPASVSGALLDGVLASCSGNNSSPQKSILNSSESKIESSDSINSTLEVIDSDIFNTSSASSTSNRSLKLHHLKIHIYENVTKLIIEDDPLLMIGIPESSMYVIDELMLITNIPRKYIYIYIYITMKKIRQNVPYAILAYDFGLSESQISRIFKNTVTKMAAILKELIVWPSKQEIALNLPIQFRLKYGQVQSIIDCFEIQIEHLTHAVHQAATWSDYKKCNTCKYLISITPDGLINFISCGYGGRSSDIEIVKNSGYLSVLPSGSFILADRGFKQIESLLHQRNCKLLRPPSV